MPECKGMLLVQSCQLLHHRFLRRVRLIWHPLRHRNIKCHVAGIKCRFPSEEGSSDPQKRDVTNFSVEVSLSRENSSNVHILGVRMHRPNSFCGLAIDGLWWFHRPSRWVWGYHIKIGQGMPTSSCILPPSSFRAILNDPNIGQTETHQLIKSHNK